MVNVENAKTGTINQKHILVVLCFALIVLSYFAVSNYTQRKSEMLQNNLKIKNEVTLLLRNATTISTTINSIRILDADIGKMKKLDVGERGSLQDRVESIETQLLQEQKLISYVQDRLDALRPEVAANDIGLISSAYAEATSSADALANNAELRERLVEAAFMLLMLVFLIAAWAAFTARDAARAAFAQDILKVEIGFLTGLVSAVFTH
jgi:hypothetical protein